ncbi:MAG: hypothetical protein Q9226_003133 [Calogaya cf. arnoldii]
MTAVKRIAPTVLAVAAGFYAGSYPTNPLSGYWSSSNYSANEPATIKLEGRNGVSSTFEKNIGDAELDAHCLNIELMRQKLRGRGRYQISSKIEGTNKNYVSFYPTNVTEDDLDVLLEVADRMRDRVQGAVKGIEVADIRKERSEETAVPQTGKES